MTHKFPLHTSLLIELRLCDKNNDEVYDDANATVVTREKCLNIATMPVGFSDPISTLLCIFEKKSVGKILKKLT